MSKPIDIGAMTILLGLSSAMLAGCDSASQSRNWKVCVDATGQRVPDAQCQSAATPASRGSWAYYSGARSVPAVGQAAAGAASAPAGGADYGAAPAEGVTRGGFGATAEGHGGGEGGGGGE